jgi:hypothetical protein
VQQCTSIPGYLEYRQAMTSCSVHRILKLGPLMWDLCASSVGCFVFISGFRSIAMEKEGSETGASIRAVGPATMDVKQGAVVYSIDQRRQIVR